MYLRVDGRQVFASNGGKSFDFALPSVVFVHGAGMEHVVWALQSRYFAYHGHNTFAVNLPGHGRDASHGQASGYGFRAAPEHAERHWLSAKLSQSAKPAYSDGPPLDSIEAIADWLPKLFDAAGIKQALLVGHSMGALAALECAARHPARVAKLALLGAAPKMPVHPVLLDSSAKDDQLAYELVTAWGHGPAGHIGGNRAPGSWLMGNAVRILARSATQVLHNDLAACNAYQNGLDAAAKLQSPTLVIAGEQDRMTPARQAKKLVDAMPDGRLVTLANCGHMMMVEQPDAALDALIDFF